MQRTIKVSAQRKSWKSLGWGVGARFWKKKKDFGMNWFWIARHNNRDSRANQSFSTPLDVTVHSYYYGKDQLKLQDQRFHNRTSLFKNWISTGNASLQLTKVEVKDQGKYKCYTSTVLGNQESFIDIDVEGKKKRNAKNTNKVLLKLLFNFYLYVNISNSFF